MRMKTTKTAENYGSARVKNELAGFKTFSQPHMNRPITEPKPGWTILPRIIAPSALISTEGSYGIYDDTGCKMAEFETPMFLDEFADRIGATFLESPSSAKPESPNIVLLADPMEDPDLYCEQLRKLIFQSKED